MGRHTTPGDGTTVQRDEVIGWGAFSTCVAGVLVGVLGGWFEAFGVVVLGGLATAALWFVRNHTAAGLGRGRHASDTPWSPSDLLELKDDEQAAGRSRAAKAPVKAAAKAPARTASGTRRARPAGRRDAPPAAAGGADPLGWLPGAGHDGPHGTPDEAPAASRRSGRRAAPVVVESGGLVDTGGRPVLDAVEPARQVPSPTASAVPGVPASRVHGEGLGPTPGFTPPIDPVPARAVPSAREPLSRRSRRGAAPQPPEGPAGPGRPVLPVAPFEMGATSPEPPRPDGVRPPAPVAFAPQQPVAQGTLPMSAQTSTQTSMPGVAQVSGPGRFPTAPVPVVPAATHAPMPPAQLPPAQLPPAATHSAPPVPPPPAPAVPPRPVTDPLSGPLNFDSVAAEPTVLDPALDPLWSAPAVELTVEQTPVPAAGWPPVPAPAATPATPVPVAALPEEPVAVDLVEAEHLDLRREQERQARRADVLRADALRAGSHRGATERDRAAAELDPLWARRARRPDVRLPGAPRPAARREPAPLEPIPGAQGQAVADPYLVVLPEPDVPDVLMIPESDVVQAPDAAPSRAVPGTLSLDELLVLHTRRPGARRSGSPDQADETGGRPLE